MHIISYNLFITYIIIYVTLHHKTSHKGQFFEIEIYTINKLSIDVWFVMIGQYLAEIQLKIWNLRVQKYLNIEKIAFKGTLHFFWNRLILHLP